MATKSNQSQARVFVLTISNEDFKQQLTDRITVGEELYSRQVQNQDELNKLKSDVKLWDDYNLEMLKQVFNYPDNDYMNTYDNAGYSFIGQLGVVSNDLIQTEKNFIKYKLENIKSLLNKADLIKSEKTNTPTIPSTTKTPSKNDVFIVHGHDDLAKTQTERFIEKLGLKPIILHEQVNSGKTIIENIEEYSNVVLELFYIHLATKVVKMVMNPIYQTERGKM
jgi:hypothetical protein